MATMDEAQARLDEHIRHYRSLINRKLGNPAQLLALIAHETNYLATEGPDAYLQLANRIDDEQARQAAARDIKQAWRDDCLTDDR